MKKGSKGLIAAGMVPYMLKADLGRAFTMPEPANMNLTNYYNHFGVNEAQIREVIFAGLSRGGPHRRTPSIESERSSTARSI